MCMAARAMMNCTLTDMRIVQPQCKWPNANAINASSGAYALLKEARLFDSTEDAIADLQRVSATTARLRDMSKTVFDARDWAPLAREGVASGEKWGVLFGGERAGLHNDDLALADTGGQQPYERALPVNQPPEGETSAGAGRGPGRPPICEEGLTQIRIRLTPEQLGKLDVVAHELNGNRSAAARLILDRLPIKPVERQLRDPWVPA